MIEKNTADTIYLRRRASSLIDEDEYGKSPGVVARLMGLDSLPNSNLPFTHSNRFLDTRSVTKPPESKHKDYHQTYRKQKVIEKFQREILPPKSARPISITQHKLLSPIKSSGFVKSADNPAGVMGTASKIPARKPSSRRPVESNAARSLRGQSMNKSWDGCLERKPLLEDGKKSVSLAVQAKVNVKRREGLSLYDQRNLQKNTLKKPLTNSVLKPNNQKQNSLLDREKSPAKSSVSEKKLSKIPMNKSVSRRKSLPENVKNRVVVKNDRNDKNFVKSNGSDVVSFTFTSPISRSTEKKNSFLDGKNDLNIVPGGDSLSTFLDQKLMELMTRSSTSVSQESEINETQIFLEKGNQDRMSVDHKLAVQESGPESERGYVMDILTDIESMFEDFTLSRTNKIVNPHLFDKLEAKRPFFEKKNEPRLRRKLVFDCVSECIDSRCRVWPRGVAAVRRKDQLVEEVCNMISGWEKMKDCMVVELVDKNMSRGQHETWLDFDFEAFELGVNIERGLLSSLIDEALDDMLVISN